jgi:type I restriction enzyme S subunit
MNLYRINDNLEAMAKAIYEYWFVQNANEKWERKSLKEIENNIVTGKTPSTSNFENFNGNIPFITIDDIRQNLFVVNTMKTLSQMGANSQNTKFIPPNSLCITCIATVGLVGFSSIESQTNQQINTIIIQNKYNRYYLYFSLKNYFEYSIGAKTGNTFANMNKGDFESIQLFNPSKEAKERFHKTVCPIFEIIHCNLKQNQHLTAFRDYLLPLLMNGQVSVSTNT